MITIAPLTHHISSKKRNTENTKKDKEKGRVKSGRKREREQQLRENEREVGERENKRERERMIERSRMKWWSGGEALAGHCISYVCASVFFFFIAVLCQNVSPCQ